MNEKILIATPDSSWTLEMQKAFSANHCECVNAVSGKEAQLLIYKQKFTTVLLDPDLASHSGIEVLKYLRLNFPAIKVILTIRDKKRGEDLALDKKLLGKMGVARVFIRPFAPDLLIQYLTEQNRAGSWREISSSESVSSEEESKIKDTEFTRVDISCFQSGGMAIFDYFIRIRNNHYLKIARQGEPLSPERINSYMQKGATHLYFLTSERRTYINFMNEVARQALGSGQVKADKILIQLKSASEQFIEEIYTNGLQPSLVQESKALTENMFSLLSRQEGMKKILEHYQEMDPQKYSHLFLVSFFAALICKNLSWVGPKTRETITLGAFLHDLGLLKVPETIRSKNPEEMTAKELQLYREHPRLGADMLADVPGISQQVIQIVYQHHESVNGTGYPLGLTGVKIYPLAKIVTVADEFAYLLTSRKVSPLLGLKELLKDREKIMNFDPAVVKALVQGFIQGK